MAADAASLFDSSLFFFLLDFCFPCGGPPSVALQLYDSGELREGGTDFWVDTCLDVDGIGIGGITELAAEEDSRIEGR